MSLEIAQAPKSCDSTTTAYVSVSAMCHDQKLPGPHKDQRPTPGCVCHRWMVLHPARRPSLDVGWVTGCVDLAIFHDLGMDVGIGDALVVPK